MKGFLKLLSIFLFPICVSLPALAQHTFEQASIGAQLHYGTFLSHEPKAQYVKDSYTSFAEVYFQQQTDGSKSWQVANNLPQWGAGLFFGNTGSRTYIGHMGGAFTYVQLPLVRRRSFTSHLRLAAGVAGVEKPYDKYSNHKNVVIGTKVNGYLNLQWQNELQLATATYLTGGISFSHLSNGGFSIPNLGLNIPALTLGVRYGSLAPAASKNQITEPLSKNVLWSLSTSAGWKQVPWVGSQRYMTNVLGAEVSRRNRRSGALGGGALLFYDRSLQVDPTTITSNKRDISRFQAGVFALYEHHLGRASIPVQLGAVVYNKDINPLIFHQVGFRYQVNRQWWAQVQLKAYGGRADLLHAGICYKLTQ